MSVATRAIRFRLRMFALRLKEQLFGVSCGSCGASARIPVPVGWRWQTGFDGEPRWVCVDCLSADSGTLQ